MTGVLKDKVAIVTGGGQGIGLAIAECLSKAGARVVIGDLQPGSDPRFHWLELDVSDERSVEHFVQKTVDDVGPPSVLVNNAGILTGTPLTEQSVAEWDRVMAVNLRGPFLMARQVVPHMRPENEPAIVNIGSIEGISGNPNHSAYMASKAGVHGLTVSMAIDLGPKGIRANAIAPGWINTDINRVYIDGLPDQELVTRQLADLHPVGRIGDPSDIGDVAVWLASSQSRFVTGQVIRVEGGRMSKLSLPEVFR
jgi:meso-butanediol dehydrogenase/(S,S)-butanediol dehydrogenase/diacetyl reductase